jgi:hypothetical protein
MDILIIILRKSAKTAQIIAKPVLGQEFKNVLNVRKIFY